MNTILVIVVVALLVGGGGFIGRRGWSKKSGLGMGFAAILMIMLLLYMMGIIR